MILPEAFDTYTRQLMGETLYSRYQQALDEDAPVSIRINPLKMRGDESWGDAHSGSFSVSDTASARVPWCAEGRYLTARPSFTFDPLFHAGLYYVQEASSMFVSYILQQLVHSPVTMLDLCAAPGGKTTAARAVLPSGSLLVANEPMKVRASILSENVQKWGHIDIMVTNNLPADYRRCGLNFDVILADVPCSGEGMFRKDSGALQEWSVQNVEKCHTLQQSIIRDIWPCLKPGGLLIYSTCTFNAREDEDNVSWIAQELGAEPVYVPVDASWGITGALTGSLPVYRFIPGKSRGEGLFMAVLRKTGVASADQLRSRRVASGAGHLVSECSASWLDGDFECVERGKNVMAVPRRWLTAYHKLSSLRVLLAGVLLGEMKGKDLVPDESLALSVALKPEAFPRVELDFAKAISYLHREPVELPADTPRGYVLVCYQGHPLGFEKNIGNRCNNLYPKEWKIRKNM